MHKARSYEGELEPSQFVNVWVEDAVHKANAGALVRVLIWQLDVDLPKSALEGRCMVSICMCIWKGPTYCPRVP
jgi:hypothetical protein